MQFPKVSKKMVSLLTISTLLSSSLAFAQLTPGQVAADETGTQNSQPSRGLTPGEVANDDRSNMDRARDQERQARDQMQRQAEERARQAEAIRIQQEAFRRADQIRQQIEDQRRRDRFQEEQNRQAQARWEADQAARRLQDQIDQQNAAIAAQQAELARQAAEVEAQRQALLRQGSASIAVSKVTRKTNGEWIRVTLATPMQLSKINIAVLEAAAQIHEAIIHTENQQSIDLNDLRETGTFKAGMSRVGDTSMYADRVIAIDIRAEAMGALATLNITVNSTEGVPTLTMRKYSFGTAK